MDEIDTILYGIWELVKAAFEAVFEMVKMMGSALIQSAGFIFKGYKGGKK